MSRRAAVIGALAAADGACWSDADVHAWLAEVLSTYLGTRGVAAAVVALPARLWTGVRAGLAAAPADTVVCDAYAALLAAATDGGLAEDLGATLSAALATLDALPSDAVRLFAHMHAHAAPAAWVGYVAADTGASPSAAAE